MTKSAEQWWAEFEVEYKETKYKKNHEIVRSLSRIDLDMERYVTLLLVRKEEVELQIKKCDRQEEVVALEFVLLFFLPVNPVPTF